MYESMSYKGLTRRDRLFAFLWMLDNPPSRSVPSACVLVCSFDDKLSVDVP